MFFNFSSIVNFDFVALCNSRTGSCCHLLDVSCVVRYSHNVHTNSTNSMKNDKYPNPFFSEMQKLAILSFKVYVGNRKSKFSEKVISSGD